jgi:serine/threonine protein phosphatase 1
MITDGLAPAQLPYGIRVYAIGDVHGCDDRLAAMHREVANDLARRPVAQPLLVHLGDYIDRGIDSAGVIARLIADPLPGVPTVNLMGNHEEMLLGALASQPSDAPAHWLANGGNHALRSWGVSPAADPRIWRGALPPDHLHFIASLAFTHLVGPYLFVHAGVRPGHRLASQFTDDLLWIREPFLSWAGDLGLGDGVEVVVHGHTPRPAPVVRANRIGVDTGAVTGGPLSCAILEADRVGFLFA